MKPKQDDDTEDDCCKENLSDAVIENLLVGVRGVAEVGFLVSRRFPGDDGTECGGCVLFYVHVLDSLKLQHRLHRDYPAVPAMFVLLGSSPVSRGKGVYNKGSPSLQQFFSGILQIYFQNG